MPTIPSNLSYTQLEPIPEPKQESEPEVLSDRLGKIAEKVALIGVFIICFSTIGISMSIAGWGVTPLTGAFVSGAIGIAFACFLLFYTESKGSQEKLIAKYRCKVLEQIRDVHSSPQIRDPLNRLIQVFSGFTEFKELYHNHSLHHDLTLATVAIDQTRPDLKKNWIAFLTHLDPLMDTTFEKERLEGKQIVPLLDWLHSQKPTYQEDLKQIEAIQKAAFKQIISGQKMHEMIQGHWQNQCALIRRQNSQEILGYAWYVRDGSKIRLMQIARKPGATYFQIGKLLLAAVLKKQIEGVELVVDLEKENPARELFRKFGFVRDRVPPNQMHLDWARYKQLTKS